MQTISIVIRAMVAYASLNIDLNKLEHDFHDEALQMGTAETKKQIMCRFDFVHLEILLNSIAKKTTKTLFDSHTNTNIQHTNTHKKKKEIINKNIKTFSRILFRSIREKKKKKTTGDGIFILIGVISSFGIHLSHSFKTTEKSAILNYFSSSS